MKHLNTNTRVGEGGGTHKDAGPDYDFNPVSIFEFMHYFKFLFH